MNELYIKCLLDEIEDLKLENSKLRRKLYLIRQKLDAAKTGAFPTNPREVNNIGHGRHQTSPFDRLRRFFGQPIQRGVGKTRFDFEKKGHGPGLDCQHQPAQSPTPKIQPGPDHPCGDTDQTHRDSDRHAPAFASAHSGGGQSHGSGPGDCGSGESGGD